MRIATYNIEWFNSLFDDDGRLMFDQHWSGRFNVRRDEQLAAIGYVFQWLDADVILIVEAPDHSKSRSTVDALERFAHHFGLRARTALIGFSNDTQQEIAVLYDPSVCSAIHQPRSTTAAPRFDNEFKIDLDIDAQMDCVTFSKPPLEVGLTLAGGRELDLLGVHLKSKAPHGARSPAEAMRLSIANRRKQLAQAIWLRRRVDEYLVDERPLIVLGDLNDGPGLDEYEHLFGRSSIEIIMGCERPLTDQLYDPNARQLLVDETAQVFSAEFRNKETHDVLRVLLDYIFVSQGIQNLGPAWTILNPYDHRISQDHPVLAAALLRASDHFPVMIDFQL